LARFIFFSVGLFSGLLRLCVILPAHSHCVYLILFVPFGMAGVGDSSAIFTKFIQNQMGFH